MNETTPTVASLLRAYRDRLGLTQPAFAELAGMSVATVRDIEQGRRREDDGLLHMLLSDLLVINPASL